MNDDYLNLDNIKLGNLYHFPNYGKFIYQYQDPINDVYSSKSSVIPLKLVFVPLEVFIDRDQYAYRIKILLTNGEIWYLTTRTKFIRDMEEVTSLEAMTSCDKEL